MHAHPVLLGRLVAQVSSLSVPQDPPMPACTHAHTLLPCLSPPYLPFLYAGPRQYYCAPRLSFPGVTLGSTYNSSVRACAAACTAHPACEAFAVDAAGSGCALRGSLFNASATDYGGMLSNNGAYVAGTGCFAANDPYFCLPPGSDVAGAPTHAIHTSPASCHDHASCHGHASFQDHASPAPRSHRASASWPHRTLCRITLTFAPCLLCLPCNRDHPGQPQDAAQP